jgi:hypothetical protein
VDSVNQFLVAACPHLDINLMTNDFFKMKKKKTWKVLT